VKPDQKLPISYWTTAAVMKQIFETKLCLAKAHSPDTCSGKIIAAHTIPRSQLKQITTDGHVYAVVPSASELARHDGQLTAKKVGIGNFSVLNCFCADHDKTLFAHLEDDPLTFDLHQLTLLHYRTLASELYRKVMSYHTLQHQLEQQKQLTQVQRRVRRQQDKKKSATSAETLKALDVIAANEQLGIS
jgi:hypothetical protein